MSKIVGVQKAIKFVQIQNRINMLLDLEIAEAVPIITESK